MWKRTRREDHSVNAVIEEMQARYFLEDCSELIRDLQIQMPAEWSLLYSC